MVIREPNLYDLYAATLLVTDKEDVREVVLVNWLEMRKNPAGYATKILIHKKKVQAILIIHTVLDSNVVIVLLGDKDSKARLIKKYKQEYPNEILKITTSEDLEDLKFLGFKIESYNLEMKGSVK